MIDAATRLIPGVLGDPESARVESFADLLLDFPQYTRPPDVRGLAVPQVVLFGDHEAIRIWRRKEAVRSHYLKRPDLLREPVVNVGDPVVFGKILREGGRGTYLKWVAQR